MTGLVKQLAADKAWAAKPEFQALQKQYDPGHRGVRSMGNWRPMRR